MSHKPVNLSAVVAAAVEANRILAGVPQTSCCEELRTVDDLRWAGESCESHNIYAEVANSSNHAVLD
jgi:hypothetical protein